MALPPLPRTSSSTGPSPGIRPEEWLECFNKATGKRYWYHPVAGTTYERPPGVIDKTSGVRRRRGGCASCGIDCQTLHLLCDCLCPCLFCFGGGHRLRGSSKRGKRRDSDGNPDDPKMGRLDRSMRNYERKLKREEAAADEAQSQDRAAQRRARRRARAQQRPSHQCGLGGVCCLRYKAVVTRGRSRRRVYNDDGGGGGGGGADYDYDGGADTPEMRAPCCDGEFFDHVRDCEMDSFDAIVCVSFWLILAGLVLLGGWAVLRILSDPQAEEAFAAADLNGDGYIIAAELAASPLSSSSTSTTAAAAAAADASAASASNSSATLAPVVVPKTFVAELETWLASTEDDSGGGGSSMSSTGKRMDRRGFLRMYRDEWSLENDYLMLTGAAVSGAIAGLWCIVIGLPWVADNTSLGHSNY
eukprot:g1411.t1